MDPTLKQAVREAYASAPAGVVALATLEMRHPAFTQPLRAVKDNKDWQFRLEASAPVDAGQLVQFQQLNFDIEHPEMSSVGVADLQIAIDNVDPAISLQVMAASKSTEPVVCTLRVYLSTDPSGPQNDPPIHFTLRQVSVDVYKVSGVCDLGDFKNRPTPYDVYSIDTHPGLAEA